MLWHAAQRGITEPLPENSMDVDPITDSEEVARLCYEAVIGSEFERRHGWHVNLMPDLVLREFPPLGKYRMRLVRNLEAARRVPHARHPRVHQLGDVRRLHASRAEGNRGARFSVSAAAPSTTSGPMNVSIS